VSEDERRLDARSLAPVLVLAAAAFVASLALHHWLFPRLSGDADEGAYVLQAKMLQSGRLTVPAVHWGAFFRPWLTTELHGRAFGPYLPGWPAMLALAGWTTGSMAVAPAAVVAAWVLATYLLALELLASRQVAVLSAALVAVCPLVLTHGALLLSYAFSAATLTFATAALLRGHRTGHAPWLLAAGAAVGMGLLNRPFDAVLYMLPVVAYVAICGRREPVWLIRSLALAAAGGVPFAIVFLAYNAAVTGDPLLAPLAATDSLNAIGFGWRRMLSDQPAVYYGPFEAFDAMRANLAGVPSWLPGGVVLIGLAVVGVVARRRRSERLLLLLLVVIVPVAHLLWWGTALSAEGANNGIGPHYYLGMVPPLTILAAAAVVAATRRSVAASGAVVVALVLAVVPSLGDKIDGQRRVSAGFDRVNALIPDDLPEPSAVIVRYTVDSGYASGSYQFLTNDLDLTRPVLFAAPVGPAEHRLAAAVPGRRLFRLNSLERTGPDDFFNPTGRLVELDTVRDRRLVLHVTVTNTTEHRTVMAFAGSQTVLLDADSTLGSTYELEWVLSTQESGPGTLTVDRDMFVVAGVAFADANTDGDAERWEYRISAGPVGSDVEVQTPGYPWREVQLGGKFYWFEGTVAPGLEVAVRAG
jgi:4-amino-4-deoxy-L-arabinose transferase-like glycosyltransferase